LHLLLREQIEMPKAWHVATGVISLGVINPIPGVDQYFLRVAAIFTV